MEWHHFEYFQTLARTQHMTHSAKILSISQSALSRSISRIEEEIGVPLFDRQGRSIILNKYGQIFLKRVDRIIKEFNEGKQEIQDLLDPEEGEVSIGFLHTIGESYIPNLIGSFRHQYPKIKFKLVENNSHTLLSQLSSGDIDIGLLSNIEIKPPIKWKILWNEELFISVPKGHPFAGYESITLGEAATEDLILLKKGISLRLMTDKFFEDAGVLPRVTFEGEEISTVAALVAAGFGISLLPWLQNNDEGRVVQIPVHASMCRRVIGLAWNEEMYLSPATRRLKNFILEHFSDE